MLNHTRQTAVRRVWESNKLTTAAVLGGAAYSRQSTKLANTFPANGYLGAPDLMFFGQGGAGVAAETATYYLYGVEHLAPERVTLNQQLGLDLYLYRLIASFAVEFSTLAGASGKIVTDTERFAHTCVETLSAYGTYKLGEYGAVLSVHSPGSNTDPATVGLPHGLGFDEYYLDGAYTGGNDLTGLNALIRQGGW